MDKKKFQKELAKAKRFTDPTLIKRNVKTVIDAKKDSDTALPRDIEIWSLRMKNAESLFRR